MKILNLNRERIGGYLNPDSVLNKYIIDPLSTVLGALFINEIVKNGYPSLNSPEDIGLSLIAATTAVDAISYNINRNVPRSIRDLFLRPAVTTGIIAYAHGTDPSYLAQVYLISLMGIHSKEIADAVIHFVRSIIQRYR